MRGCAGMDKCLEFDPEPDRGRTLGQPALHPCGDCLSDRRVGAHQPAAAPGGATRAAMAHRLVGADHVVHAVLAAADARRRGCTSTSRSPIAGRSASPSPRPQPPAVDAVWLTACAPPRPADEIPAAAAAAVRPVRLMPPASGDAPADSPARACCIVGLCRPPNLVDERLGTVAQLTQAFTTPGMPQFGTSQSLAITCALHEYGGTAEWRTS